MQTIPKMISFLSIDSNSQAFNDTIPRPNVWVGIIEDIFISPFLLTENVTGDLYFAMPLDTIHPFITQVVKTSIDFPEDHIISEENIVSQ